MLDWNIAVYAANEAARLHTCLNSIAAALSGRNALITVILNGTTDGSLNIARNMPAGTPIEIFDTPHGDKSNAINQFFHTLRSPARFYAGVDGYAAISPNTFNAMQARFETDAKALAVSGIAASGRTMQHENSKILTQGGRLHGQLHALRPEFIDRIVARGLRLPVGLYRGDGLLGSMAAHDLDPISVPWKDARIPAEQAASFSFPVLSPFKLADLRRQFRREIRQMRGRIENAAIKSLIYQGGYEALPANADDMIRDYLAIHAAPSVPLPNRLFMQLAVRENARAARPDADQLIARRVG